MGLVLLKNGTEELESVVILTRDLESSNKLVVRTEADIPRVKSTIIRMTGFRVLSPVRLVHLTPIQHYINTPKHYKQSYHVSRNQ